MSARDVTIGVLAEVSNERLRQDRKYGVRNMNQGLWLGILGEEYGEACRAAVSMAIKTSRPHNLREELLHVAAVAVATIECIDRDGADLMPTPVQIVPPV